MLEERKARLTNDSKLFRSVMEQNLTRKEKLNWLEQNSLTETKYSYPV